MNETKYTVQLDNKSVLTVKDLHREVLSDQKQALEEYKLEQKGIGRRTLTAVHRRCFIDQNLYLCTCDGREVGR